MSAAPTTPEPEVKVTLHGSTQALALAYAERHGLTIALPKRPAPRR